MTSRFAKGVFYFESKREEGMDMRSSASDNTCYHDDGGGIAALCSFDEQRLGIG